MAAKLPFKNGGGAKNLISTYALQEGGSKNLHVQQGGGVL